MFPLSADLKRKRLLALGITVSAFVLSFFQRFAPAGIAQDLAATFETSAASLGVLAATYFYVYTIMQVPTGVMVDTLGPRRVLVTGAIIGGIGSLIFGLAPNLNTALAGRLLIGLGVSVTFVSMLKIIAVWFEENRFASITGVTVLLGNLGSVLAGAPLATVASSVGWRGVFISVGFISLGLALGCWFLVRDSVSNSPKAQQTTRFDRTVVFGNLLKIAKNPATHPAILVNFGTCGAFFTFGGLWAMPYLMQVHDLSRNEAASHLSLLFLGFAVGSLIMGNLSDRLGKRRPILITACTLNALIWMIWVSGVQLPFNLSYVLILLMGLCTSGFTLGWSCAKEVNPPMLSGMSTSVANMGGFLAAAIFQPLVGLVIDMSWDGQILNGVRIYSTGDFQAGFLLLGTNAWIGAWGAWRIRETGCRNIWQPPPQDPAQIA
jgi:predicted MFS family arabinose efflux permease